MDHGSAGSSRAGSGSVAESLGPVRELKAYLLCHELCRNYRGGGGEARSKDLFGQSGEHREYLSVKAIALQCHV